MADKNIKIIANNKKAYHDYFVLEKLETGISLAGTEVKSLRQGKANLKESFCSIDGGQLCVIGMHISPYEQGNRFNCDPMRKRTLLAHKIEILRLFNSVKKDGLTLIPLSLYFSGSKVKLEIGLCQGKKLHDKRESLAKKQAEREIDRGIKERTRG